jgi:hypothetical protein
LKGTIQYIDFPGYMDEESKTYLMKRAAVEMAAELLSKQ